MAQEKSLVIAVSHDVKIREAARAVSGLEGLEIILCGDGEEALESIKDLKDETGRIKLIVLEAFLPKVDGYEVVSLLKDIPRAKEIPVLMLIDRKSQLSVRNICMGADEYLEKPFETSELKAQIHSMIKHYRAHGSPHPVTGLKGHPEMEQEVINRIGRGESFELLCVDVNHFRPYNDRFGVEKGNDVIRMMVKLVQKSIKSADLKDVSSCFFAHVDGDDFMILTGLKEANEIRRRLRDEFSKEVLSFYPEKERAKGLFHGVDRESKESVFPFMSLSTAVLEVKVEKFVHYGFIVSELNELLHQAKIGEQDVR